ncbi:MAG: 50S ribosomal protein L11 methyltransferase [Ruminococcaceae bacterium]|nr:50S ribosomal protein L11 methyltransferase [Oscillospiraceae bacterium]
MKGLNHISSANCKVSYCNFSFYSSHYIPKSTKWKVVYKNFTYYRLLFCPFYDKIMKNDTEVCFMAYLEISVTTTSDTIEEVAAKLTAHGYSELVLEDQGEFEQFLDENRAYWDYIDEDLQQKLQGLSCIKLYLEDGNQAGLARLEQLISQMDLQMSVTPLAEENWEESWKDNYPPQPVGQRLVVLPYWLADTDTEGRLPIILDPGLTFGTGAHPSTQMVLETMEDAVQEGASCLDLGSGSGILSIAALRLGAKTAVGVDIDPKAEDIARENAAYNGYALPQFAAYTGNVIADKGFMDTLSQGQYDVVLVNIVADVIIGLAPVLPRFMTEKTLLICSGILDTRLTDVVAALEQAGLVITRTKAKEDWRCVSAKRRTL